MTSRLRLAVMASHHEQELRAAARTIGAAARAVGLDPAARTPVASQPDRSGLEMPGSPQPAVVGDMDRRVRAGVFDFEASQPVRRAA
jgi:hypothetical protein